MKTRVYGKAPRRPRHSVFESIATPSPPKHARSKIDDVHDKVGGLEHGVENLKLEPEVAKTPRRSPRRCPLKETHCNTITSPVAKLTAGHKGGDTVGLEDELASLKVQAKLIESPQCSPRRHVRKDIEHVSRDEQAAAKRGRNGATIEIAASSEGQGLGLSHANNRLPNCNNSCEGQVAGPSQAFDTTTLGLEGLSLSPKPRQPLRPRRQAYEASKKQGTTNSDLDTLALETLTISSPVPFPSESSKPTISRPHTVPKTRRRISFHISAKPRLHPISLDGPTTAYLSPLLPLSPPIEDFQLWLSSRLPHISISKIGEGSYGEVYRATPYSSIPTRGTDISTKRSRDSQLDSVIFKLIPLRPRTGPGSRNAFTSPQAAAKELKLLTRMSTIPGFVEFRGACLLKGRMPAALVEEWVRYKGEGLRSVESRDPRGRGGYGANQIWCLVEMSDAGCDLEGWVKSVGMRKEGDDGEGRVTAMERIWDVWWQVVGGLARGEMGAGFEHRDLHWGNVCVREDGPRQRSTPSRNAEVEEGEEEPQDPANEVPFGMHASSCQVSIIDYTLSRVELEDGAIISTNLDEDEDLMCSDNPIYREMMDVHRRSWDSFEPVTNVMWVEHLLGKLLEAVLEEKGDNTEQMEEGAKRQAKEGAEEEKRARTKKMAQILKLVQKMLSCGMRRVKPLNSAGEVLVMAVRCGWVRVEDFLDG